MSCVRMKRPLGPEASQAATCPGASGVWREPPGRLSRKFPQVSPSRSLAMSSGNSRLRQVRVRKRELAGSTGPVKFSYRSQGRSYRTPTACQRGGHTAR